MLSFETVLVYGLLLIHNVFLVCSEKYVVRFDFPVDNGLEFSFAEVEFYSTGNKKIDVASNHDDIKSGGTWDMG
eukprot:Pgem_evm1s18936